MIRVTLLVLVGLAAPAQQIYDLLIKNGHVIDPAAKRNGRFDIGIREGKIVAIGAGLISAHAKASIDASRYYVTPGLIDLHIRLGGEGGGLGLNADHNALRQGVTTVVDAGSSSAADFERFRKNVIRSSLTRVLAFLKLGDGADAEAELQAALAVARNYPQEVAGFYAAFSSMRRDAVNRALLAARRSGTLALINAQAAQSTDIRELALTRLQPGDLLAPVYGSHIRLLGQQQLPSYLFEARRRGVLFDLGHGSAGFFFPAAAAAIAQGFLPDTISTGLDAAGALLPQASMSAVMSKLLNLGMSLEQIIERATLRPAQALRRPQLGVLTEGGDADIAVLALEEGRYAFLDAAPTKLRANRRLRPVLTIRAGRVVYDSDGLAAEEWRRAGPYSNFK